MKYIVIAAIVFSVVACSKKDNPSPKTQSADIVGTWHLTWEWAIDHGTDTIYSDKHSRTDASYTVAINADGKVNAPGFPYSTEYYKVVDDTMFLSEDVLPSNPHTTVGVEHDENPDSIYHTGEIQGWHIDKLTADSMALSMFGLETTDSYTYDIFVK